MAGGEKTAERAGDDKIQHQPPAIEQLRAAAIHPGKVPDVVETASAHLNDKFSIGDNHSVDKLHPGDNHQSFTVDGKQREYEVHLPPNYDGKKPIPVMYLMPGVGGNIEQMKKETGMNREADAKGFAVVYTQALNKPVPGFSWVAQSTSWNLDHGSLTDKVGGYDDLNYMKEVDQRIGKQVNVDPEAKYIAGFSEGGGAAQYIAEKMPHTFAGVGSVHGTHLDSDLQPNKDDPTAFVAIHGDADHMLPLDGGRGFMTLTMSKVKESKPLEQKDVWAKANDCGPEVTTDDKYNRTTEYTCKGGPVEEIIRHKGQHAWDGMGQDPANGNPRGFPWRYIGDPQRSQDTTKDLVNALMHFRKPDGTVSIARDFKHKETKVARDD